MKTFRAVIDSRLSFYVVARTPEAAYAEAVNCTTRLWLEYGITAKVQRVEEV